ncbi:MAG TPA: LacI family DNA-binding transcriptional regulator [Acholeplasmataceae bacterium]|nr:LacI family DNA-binding transcriptional regulator [Acholeplasmataceae bacterium]
MPTIKDVAKLAQVSISTASYALNNNPHVLPETRKRVIDAAKTLNYYPHGAARNLKMKKSKNVGVFIYAFGGPVFSDILEGIRQTLQEYDFNIIVSSGKSSENLLKERQIDGAIIFDNYISDTILQGYASHGMPVFILDRILQGEHLYPSLIDNEGLVMTMMERLIQKGYRRFAYASGPQAAFNNKMRQQGFLAALQIHHLSPVSTYPGDFTIRGGYEIGLSIIKQTDWPEVVFCANDEMAIGLIQAIQEKGYRVPRDLKVVGFDHIPLGDVISPKLTTIAIDHALWGRSIARAMIDIIGGKKLKVSPSPQGKILMRESA